MARMMKVLLDLHDITSLYSVPPVKDSVTESPDDKRNQHHRCELRSCWSAANRSTVVFLTSARHTTAAFHVWIARWKHLGRPASLSHVFILFLAESVS